MDEADLERRWAPTLRRPPRLRPVEPPQPDSEPVEAADLGEQPGPEAAHAPAQPPPAAVPTDIPSPPIPTWTWNGAPGVVNFNYGTSSNRPLIGGSYLISDRPTAQDLTVTSPAAAAPLTEDARAFVTNIDGRTLITGPAATIKAGMRDPSVEDITSQHMLYMHGRFVGAEAANRNGAFWSAGDLEMSYASVVNGPLNWLHDARHIIGTLSHADYIDPRTAPASAAAGQQPVQPHITATAAIWKWIYPDESYVIQQASDAEHLWYSMECISKEVSCVGDAGCGNTTSYAQYMAGMACEHVQQRASVRRFVDPVFLGGAVIVPPTRPGWAEADARVMSRAGALAEAAFEQAGRPDVSAGDWEQLMGQLVRYCEK